MYYNIHFFNYVIDSSYDGNPQKVPEKKIVYNYLELNIIHLLLNCLVNNYTIPQPHIRASISLVWFFYI